ncbi:MAG: ATP-binding protein [bacterium]
MDQPVGGEINYRDFPILFVDDREGELSLYRKRLGTSFSVLIAHSHDEARTFVSRTPRLAVIVVGRHLCAPGFLDTLRKEHPHIISIILLHADDAMTLAEDIDRRNIYAYIMHPYPYDRLKLKMRRAIEHHILEREQVRLLKDRCGMEGFLNIGELTNVFAHEIRNPITVISLHAEMNLAKMGDDAVHLAKARDSFAEILNQCQQLVKAIDQMAAYTRALEEHRERIRLDRVIERSLFLLKHTMDFSSIHVMTDIPADIPEMLGDPMRFEQVFMRLFRHSYNAMNGSGTITMSCTLHNDTNAVSIDYADEGPGMSREAFRELVGKFFSRIRDGVGLDLYVTYRMIVSMGGCMMVEECGAQGNVIRISFPFKRVSELIPETVHEEGRAWEDSYPPLMKECDDDLRITLQ